MVRDWIRKALSSAGYVVFNSRSRAYYAQDSLFTTNNDSFRDDPLFKAAYSRGVKASGGVDPQIEWRLHVAFWAARHAAPRLAESGETLLPHRHLQRSGSHAVLERRDRSRPSPRRRGCDR